MTRSHNTYKTWQETKLSNTQNDNAHNANGNTIRKEKIGDGEGKIHKNREVWVCECISQEKRYWMNIKMWIQPTKRDKREM